jgi:hypothetical protein
LQEQKRDQWQRKPLGGSHDAADQAIEAAQQDRQIGIPLLIPAWLAGDAVLIAPVSSQIPLLTGNFTGNFAILAPCEPISMQDTAVLQRFIAQFPKQIIREKISKNKEFLGGIREFDMQNFKM